MKWWATRVVRDEFFIAVVLRSGKSDPSGSAAAAEAEAVHTKKRNKATK